MPHTSQGQRQKYLRRNLLNPRNDRDIRLDNEFQSSATRGNIFSPQIAMPVGLNEQVKNSRLAMAQSTQELHSSYETKHLRNKKGGFGNSLVESTTHH